MRVIDAFCGTGGWSAGSLAAGCTPVLGIDCDETPLKRCSFFWICRDEREFQSFKDVLSDILADTALANIFELNTCAAQLQSIRMIT